MARSLRRRVLLVDDDPLLLEVLTTVLDLEEFEVLAASDGDTALDLATRERIDLVVGDVRMPGKDAEEGRAAGEAAGCDAYVAKPFSAIELLEVMRAQPAREPPPEIER